MDIIFLIAAIFYVIVAFYMGGAWYVLGHGVDTGDKIIAIFLGLTWPVWVLLIIFSSWL